MKRAEYEHRLVDLQAGRAQPNLGEIRRGRQMLMRWRFTAERARMWGA